MDALLLRILQPGESVTNALTLLRGGQGPLFPAPGVYRIRVDATWDAEGMEITVSGEASTVVTAAVDEAHAAAALKILTTPDTLLTLALGGDHLTDGVEAIRSALDNPVLRPHFAYIEAKRVARRFGKRKPDLKAAAALVDEETVMTPAEIMKAAELAKADGSGAPAKAMAKTLKAKVAKEDVGDEVAKAVRAL